MKDAGDVVAGAVGDLETLYHYCDGINPRDYCKEIQSKRSRHHDAISRRRVACSKECR